MLSLVNPTARGTNLKTSPFYQSLDYKEITITEMLLNLMQVNLADLPENKDVKTPKKDLKAYKISLFSMFLGNPKSIACFRSKVNNVLTQYDKINHDNTFLIETYEYIEGGYEIRRVNIENYIKLQQIKQDEDLPACLLLSYA